MSQLSIGPIPKVAQIRLAITLPEPLKADLDRYAVLHEQTYGNKVNSATLIPHILAAFLAKDREFQKTRKASKLFGDE